ALTCAGRLFEGVFETMNSFLRPPPAISERLEENARHLKAGGERARGVEPVSFPIVREAKTTWAEGRLPDPLPLETRDAEARRPSGLFWHIGRAVVAAHFNLEHPLRRTLAEQPDWLFRMHAVSRMRNKAGAHFGPIPIALNDGLQQARNALDMVIDLLGRL